MGDAAAHLAGSDNADFADIELHDVCPMNNTGNRCKISMLSHTMRRFSTTIRAV